MRKTFIALCALSGLTACSLGSVSGPSGWFGNRAEPLEEQGAAVERRAPSLVAALEEAEVAATRQGVIIRATGVAPTQGYYNARLVPASAEPPEGSVLTLVLLADPPEQPQPVGTVASRRLVAAMFLHDNDLPQIRTIRIQSAGPARNLSR